ncbi:MAG: DeoR family transcriptional regulator [Kangiella sp.]|nr:MAG: DeoR family transcriptional regulator [Kangiella sp.]
MKPSFRQSKIIDLIREKQRIDVNDLAKHFGASRETIRRDLSALSKEGKIQKVHGGAVLAKMSAEGSFQRRMERNVQEKRQIAKEAVKLFSPRDTIFIDTGSTSIYFAEEMAKIDDLTIITNSALLAKVITQNNASNKVFLLGGEYSGDNQETFGSLAIQQIKTFRAHHVVLTIGALDSLTGVMDFNINEAQIASAMIEQAQSLTVLADHTKFNNIASFQVCPLDRITTLVCDQMPAKELHNELIQQNVEIIEAC